MSDEKVLKFKIQGKVKAKQSVKFAQIGNFVKKYTPKDKIDYANWVKQCFCLAYPDFSLTDFLNCAVEIEIRAFFAMPKSFSKMKKIKAKYGVIKPTVKPDWDNIAKNICDALNGIAYLDDKAIVSGSVHKRYAESDYVEVSIQYLKN